MRLVAELRFFRNVLSNELINVFRTPLSASVHKVNTG